MRTVLRTNCASTEGRDRATCFLGACDSPQMGNSYCTAFEKVLSSRGLPRERIDLKRMEKEERNGKEGSCLPISYRDQDTSLGTYSITKVINQTIR